MQTLTLNCQAAGIPRVGGLLQVESSRLNKKEALKLVPMLKCLKLQLNNSFGSNCHELFKNAHYNVGSLQRQIVSVGRFS